MIESAAYEIIKQEGFEEGYNKGLLKGKEEGFKEGLQEGIQEGLREAIELGLKLKFGVEGLKLLPEIEKVKEVELLKAIKEAIEVATSIEEIKQFLKQD